MKITAVFSIFCFLSILGLSSAKDRPSVRRLIIKKSFSKNPKIWGTYDQLGESTLNAGKKKMVLHHPTQTGDLIIKKNSLVFIRPIDNKDNKQAQTNITVKALPYQKVKKNTYKVQAQKVDKELYEMYHQHIIAYYEKYFPGEVKILNKENLSFKEMNCIRKKKKMACQLKVDVNSSI
jgi:hypothetical protein